MKKIHIGQTIFVSSLLFVANFSFSHPIPDIPIRASFDSNGNATFLVEVDPRCFMADALNEPYFTNSEMPTISKKEQQRLFKEAGKFIEKFVALSAEPIGKLKPEFSYKFTSFDNEALSDNPTEDDETPIMVTAQWNTNASAWKAYWVSNSKTNRFSVQFINFVKGEKQPLNVLFPGETSYRLDLSSR